MRINKYLADSGISSRRKAEEFILAGKVKVNGKIVKELSTDIKDTDIVYFDNRPIRTVAKYVYYKLNKPKGYVTTVSDEKGRKTVMELMRGVHTRVYPVGRLDYDSEGLIIMTNDGDFTNLLTKPNSKIDKTYIVQIEGAISTDEIKTLTKGVDIGGYVTEPCSIELMSTTDKLSRLKVVIHEGKNRQIRKMFAAINKNVVFLRRTIIGEINLGGLSRGEYTEFNPKELKYVNRIKTK